MRTHVGLANRGPSWQWVWSCVREGAREAHPAHRRSREVRGDCARSAHLAHQRAAAVGGRGQQLLVDGEAEARPVRLRQRGARLLFPSRLEACGQQQREQLHLRRERRCVGEGAHADTVATWAGEWDPAGIRRVEGGQAQESSGAREGRAVSCAAARSRAATPRAHASATARHGAAGTCPMRTRRRRTREATGEVDTRSGGDAGEISGDCAPR